jgi:hypothetical protein
MVTVDGTATLDGAPLEGAAVMMQPDGGGAPATATTDASGNFTLQTVPGPHKIAVTKTKSTGGAEAGVEEDGVLLSGDMESQQIEYITPMQYASPMTSGLSVDVQSGMQPVTLDLKSQ